MHISAIMPRAVAAAGLDENEYKMTYFVEGDVVYFTIKSKTSDKRIVLDMVVDMNDIVNEVRLLYNDLLFGDQCIVFVNFFTTCVKVVGL